MNLRTIYSRMCDGDHIRDPELEAGIRVYQEAHDALIKLGPAFEITRKALGQTLISMQDIQMARKR